MCGDHKSEDIYVSMCIHFEEVVDLTENGCYSSGLSFEGTKFCVVINPVGFSALRHCGG